MTKHYHGSCHCGAVTYEADLDLSKGTYRCNCTYCRKVRNWIIMSNPAEVRLTTGADKVATYKMSAESPTDYDFCSICGVRLWSKGYHESVGGDFLNLMISTLDDVDDDELAKAPMQWGDGLHDDYMKVPEKTDHL